MKKLKFLMLVFLISTFNLFGQENFTRGSVTLMDNFNCEGSLQVCFEVCWTSIDDEDCSEAICNAVCNQLSAKTSYLFESGLSNVKVCSNKLIINLNGCQVELPSTEWELNRVYEFNQCGCCFRVKYLGEGAFQISGCVNCTPPYVEQKCETMPIITSSSDETECPITMCIEQAIICDPSEDCPAAYQQQLEPLCFELEHRHSEPYSTYCYWEEAVLQQANPNCKVVTKKISFTRFVGTGVTVDITGDEAQQLFDIMTWGPGKPAPTVQSFIKGFMFIDCEGNIRPFVLSINLLGGYLQFN